jgi:AcrR family transcriptional regulator
MSPAGDNNCHRLETPVPSRPETAPRDRDQTERRLVEAARHVLADAGFQGFGVNAVARRAGCDKQLIYRYFGGLSGLLDAIGNDLAGWLTGRLPKPPHGASYADIVETLVLAYYDALRADPLVQRIALWELAAPSEQLTRIGEARGRVMMRWMKEVRGDSAPPPGVDAPVINALLIAAVQFLALAERAGGRFSGLDLSDEASRARARAGLVRLVQATYRTS